MSRSTVLVLGPHRAALSGVSTHLNLLFGSRLAEEHALLHFQVGSEGRNETGLARLARFVASPLVLGATILSRNVALVHVNTSLNVRAFLRDAVYMVVARLCGARVLCQVHGGALPQDFFAGHSWLSALLRRTLSLPDVVAVLAREELDAYRRFVPEQLVVLVPNGVDCTAMAGVRRQQSTSARTPLRLLYMGRVVKEKGLIELLQALRLADADGCRLRLIIAGDGPDGSALRQYAADLGIAGLVSFVPSVAGAGKAKLLARSDVLVLVSHAEGMPYALLEGMAAGAAVLATPVGAIPDVVVEGEHGLLVPPRDPRAIHRALTKLSADRALLARMGVACRKRIAGAFSIEQLAVRLGGIYDILCGGPSVRRVREPAGAGTDPR
jgi:glycosyltransferase involved in cell wall biosynthesis